VLPPYTLFTYSSGTLPIRWLLFKNNVSTAARTGDNSPVRKLWLRSTIDPSPYIDDGGGDGDGTPPDKLFRCKNKEERVGLRREEGMGPLNWFMLKSRNSNSDNDWRPLSGPPIMFFDADK
jgi:hypothetical protein